MAGGANDFVLPALSLQDWSAPYLKLPANSRWFITAETMSYGGVWPECKHYV